MASPILNADDRIEANDHLLKAVVALLTIKDPEFVKQLDDVFLVARMQASEISHMDPQAWAHIQEELEVVRSFVLGDEDPKALLRESTPAALKTQNASA